LSHANSRDSLGNVRVAHSHIFFPLGLEGMDIYTIEASG